MEAAGPTTNLAAGATVLAFAAPIATHRWPESAALNRELARLALAREAASDGLHRANLGGWHSGTDLLAWGGPAVEALHGRIRRFGADLTALTLRGVERPRVNFRIEAWANVAREGDYIRPHDHAGFHWSGVYYVADGEPAGATLAGALEFLDPRAGAAMVPLPAGYFDGQIVVKPEPGLMVLFPSWLRHFVHPHRGAGARISIAFNIQIRAPEG